MKNTPASPATILVVEDSADLLDLLGFALNKQGYAVLSSLCQEQALSTWEKHRGHIDLLVTDVRLGASGSGLDLAEKLLALKPSLKVLAISGCFPTTHLPQLSGQVELLQKPFAFTDVLARVDTMLRPALAPGPSSQATELNSGSNSMKTSGSFGATSIPIT